MKAREVVLEALNFVSSKRGYVQNFLADVFKKERFSKKDRGLITEVAMGTLRQQGSIDWMLSKFSSRKLEDIESSVLNILRLGTYQIMYLDRVPRYAAVDEAVKLAHQRSHRGSAKFVNAVLRKVAAGWEGVDFPEETKDPVLHIATKYSHPEWLVRRWIDSFGVEETKRLCEANNAVPPLTIKANALRVKKEDLIRQLEEEGVATESVARVESGLRISGFDSLDELKSFRDGLFYVQDEAVQIVPYVVASRAGDFVLDLCAAPGGKTAGLAELMKNKGRILAVDANKERLELLEENCGRLGIGIVETKVADVRRLGKALKSKADKILLDVPCSNLGVLRRRVEAKWNQSLENIQKLSKLQWEMLQAAANYLKVGGTLTYSTCTLLDAENEGVVRRFLNGNKDFAVERGLPSFLADLVGEDGFIRTYPHRHKMDGIFVAKLRRVGENG